MPGNSSFVRTGVPNLSGWQKRPKPPGFIGQSPPDQQVTKEMFYALETHEERLKLLVRLKRAAWVAVDFSGSRATGTYQVKKLSSSGVITLFNNVDHELYTIDQARLFGAARKAAQAASRACSSAIKPHAGLGPSRLMASPGTI